MNEFSQNKGRRDYHINVIQLILKVTSFTFWFMQWEALHRIIKYVNYVNLQGNCVNNPGTKWLKFIALEFKRNF